MAEWVEGRAQQAAVCHCVRPIGKHHDSMWTEESQDATLRGTLSSVYHGQTGCFL